MNVDDLLSRGLKQDFLTADEGVFLFEHATTSQLMFVANELRKIKKNNSEKVTWIIDRNLNTTNVCIANCKFCNFFRIPGHAESYITDIETYKRKIEETIRYGGEQLLLQGGHHPDLGLSYYVNLVLKALMEAGLDSLPGAGAEILNDRVRRLISKGKCTGREWLDVMRAAHQLGLTTSATMMFGHVETTYERFEHLVWLREVQEEKPKDAKGFIAFIPWPFQDDGTLLNRLKGIKNNVTKDEYIRMLSLSRIMLPNIENIQASWLTVGKETAQLCLHAGANDFGSIMIEENVVSAAGAPHRFTYKTIQEAIKEAGFEPQLRNQQYQYRDLPEHIEEQVVDY